MCYTFLKNGVGGNQINKKHQNLYTGYMIFCPKNLGFSHLVIGEMIIVGL